ncbi:DUF5103 domain-containing protein [Polaribacter sargassicola]|uniref:type IX secretion system plug protein n=1 Tax=Polaribacter sargassicola TaxID=2836891 RepID=UPI001F2AEC25|nr:DUF5103 domain-containing protein [Polaribacter sp. DS7-9]MCG1036188.1 DUF5103 domain-containing protein [Polaribacter sp. DS7-9]
MRKKNFILIFIFLSFNLISQNIKSIQLRPLQEDSFSSIVPLGTILELSFDDLDADSKDYQYKIEHMTHNWESSRLASSQYIDGFNQNTIIDVTNSFNTLQNYKHYSVQIPNTNTVITKSGNYLLSVLNSYDEVIFTKRFVLYENLVTTGVLVERSRNTKTLNTQQTVQFSINHPNLKINNPNQEINVVILKNNNWNEKITNIQPTFFKQNQLLYTYTNKTNFWGGNEYTFFDTKLISNKSLNIAKIIKKDIYHHYIYPFTYNPFKGYVYNPDINGQFVIRTIEADDSATEADYASMHFSLITETPFANKKVYIYGAFNDFNLTDENEMQYDENTRTYTGNLLLKQGFYNYTYVTLDSNKKIDANEINGSFYQTENEYTVIVYYKPFGSFYERVVGIGTGYFNQNK